MIERKEIPLWTVPLALLILCALTYAIQSNQLGFYWDDWPAVWFLHSFGPGIFKESFAIDRPVLSWLYLVTTPIMGESPFAWQLFGIFSRWLCGLSLWWVLRLLWPRQATQVTWMVFLFTVYPGFRQQHIAFTYSHAFLLFVIFLVSIGVMIQAVRDRRWFWPGMSLALLGAILNLAIAEYFLGLELLRPIFLWIAQDKLNISWRKRLRQVVVLWAPFLIILIGYVFWRGFLSDTPRAEIVVLERLSSSPLPTLIELVKLIVSDIFTVSGLAWLATVNPTNLKNFEISELLVYLGVVIGVTGLTSAYFLKLKDKSENETHPVSASKWAVQAIGVGVFAIFVGGWPIWVTNLRLHLKFPADRFTLFFMLGVAVLWVGLTGLLHRHRHLRVLIIGGMVGLSSGLHFQDAILYRQDWQIQKDFFWQLSWRAPQIQPGTMILTSNMPFMFNSDNSLIAPLNWTYNPQQDSRILSYAIFNLDARMGNLFTHLAPEQTIEYNYRVVNYYGSTSQVITLIYSPPRCLKVVDSGSDIEPPYKLGKLKQAQQLSDLRLITLNSNQPAKPPSPLLGNEPFHGWCYYFEKAELASQFGDWREVVVLAEQALQMVEEINPINAPELIPFIKGYALLGRWQDALSLSQKVLQASDKMSNLMCTTWQFIMESTSPEPDRETAISQIKKLIQCELP